MGQEVPHFPGVPRIQMRRLYPEMDAAEHEKLVKEIEKRANKGEVVRIM